MLKQKKNIKNMIMTLTHVTAISLHRRRPVTWRSWYITQLFRLAHAHYHRMSQVP